MTQEEAKKLIIKEWLDRPASERTANLVLAFYGELEQTKKHLLKFRCPGDKYQRLQGWLKPYTE